MASKKTTSPKEASHSIIKNHMIWSMGAGLVPVPIVDFFAVGAIQLDMIRQLSKIYEIDFKETEGKALITAFTGSGLARLGAGAIKFIPGVGQLLGSLTMSALSGATTYALGEVFNKHFETGGTFLDFDPSRLMDFYNEKFEKGKDIAKNMKKEADISSSDDSDAKGPEIIKEDTKSLEDQLNSLSKMKEQGLLTSEEFDELKKKIEQRLAS